MISPIEAIEIFNKEMKDSDEKALHVKDGGNVYFIVSSNPSVMGIPVVTKEGVFKFVGNLESSSRKKFKDAPVVI